MKNKYYFQNKGDKFCYDTAFFQEQMEFKGLMQMEVFEAIPEIIPNNFWCKKINACGEKGTCGKICQYYDPRNGKSGICWYHSNRFYTPGEKITLKLKN